jgi:hypothetical protein
MATDVAFILRADRLICKADGSYQLILTLIPERFSASAEQSAIGTGSVGKKRKRQQNGRTAVDTVDPNGKDRKVRVFSQAC